jgi:hypothetical protein
VLERARVLVPQIEDAPGAKEGEVRDIDECDLVSHLDDGDIVLCRVTAPLISLCYKLLMAGVRAKVRGRAIGQGIASLARDINHKARRWSWFCDELDKWEMGERQRILRLNGNDEECAQLASIRDRADVLRVIHANVEPRSLDDLLKAIDDLFEDETRPSVWLSTVHRAKGLEADNVFILKPDLLPFPYAKQDWQIQQELNLEYVALTRAKETLTFVWE